MRLPWVRCQRQTPSEASVLQEARAAWAILPLAAPAPQAAPAQGRAHDFAALTGSAAADDYEHKSDETPGASRTVALPLQPASSLGTASLSGTGPLLLFPDTSAMLAMMGAEQASSSTPLTLHLLEVLYACTLWVKSAWTMRLVLSSWSKQEATMSSGHPSVSGAEPAQAKPVVSELLVTHATSAEQLLRVHMSMGMQCLLERACVQASDADVQALARQGLFGRGLPPEQQTFVVVTDSVAKQLDGLKKDPALSSAVRRFWSHGLDACGPAGALRSGVPAHHAPDCLSLPSTVTIAGGNLTRHLFISASSCAVSVAEIRCRVLGQCS